MSIIGVFVTVVNGRFLCKTESCRLCCLDLPIPARRAAPAQSQPGSNPTAVQIGLVMLVIVVAVNLHTQLVLPHFV